MIFKGFTDENGNVIPVQGAGTVYNEEKNSLALGKETVATGQDQFVFGRSNVADANKVEVVGGGNGGAVDKIILTYGEPSQQFTLTRIGTSLDINEVNSKASSLMRRPTVFGYKNWTPGESDILVFYFWDRENDGDGTYENYPFFIFLNGKVTRSTEKGMSDNNHRYWVYEPSVTPTSVEEIIAKKNIRTLDWEGNEELAGSLTVGTGITVGETALSEAELIALKALLNT